MIEGLHRIELKRFPDERGTVMHMLKSTDEHFQGFGEIYFSTIHAGVVKAWHRDAEMGLNYACISGRIKIAAFDDREDSPTRGERVEYVIGPDSDYALIQIPPNVWNGFTGLGSADSIVANCATLPHDWSRSQRRPYDDPFFGYDWGTSPADLRPR